MNKFKIYKGSENYTCQVIKLPNKVIIKGLDNLVEVSYQGNSVLISKDSPENELYLFFPAECQISHDFLSKNNLYRHTNLNVDENQKGFFEDTRRVKVLKLKGIISSGFIIPANSIMNLSIGQGIGLTIGSEFNEIDGYEVCRKYHIKQAGAKGLSNPRVKVLDNIINSKLAPEHTDTSHLMKNIHKFDLRTNIIVTYKLHGTSARTFHTVVKRKLTWRDKIAKFIGASVKKQTYDYVVGSRRTLKSVGFEELPKKNHYFTSGDLWSEVAKIWLKDGLNKGESIYYEIVGKTYNGETIQKGYSYGLEFPKIFVYRIANINVDGIEIDLPWEQVKHRTEQLGLNVCPVFFEGSLGEFLVKYSKDYSLSVEENLNEIFYNQLLEKPSILDSTVIEEGFCVRVDKYPKAETYKIKSKIFLKQESDNIDKNVIDIEEQI